MPPETIGGRYRVESVVGHGGMGSVWLCTDQLLGRKVAVKQVGTLPGETTVDVARALREARNSAALQHRNVVSIYDAVEEGGRIWLVMEHVPGRTLAQILADEGPLSPERAVWIGEQVAQGLAAAHARGTSHRDVKPGNIFVTLDDVAKVGDFGIARTSGDPELTRAGLVTGTPAYFSPEVARGESPTPAADVWALGATLFVAVEGRPLYPEQENPIALLGVIASTPPPRPEHARFLAEPITRMLDPDPRSRWSMTDVAHVLHRLRERHAAADTRSVTAVAGLHPSVPATPPPSPWRPESSGAASSPAEGDEEAEYAEGAEDPVALDSRGAADRARPAVAPRRGRDPGGRLLLLGVVAVLVLAAVGGFLLLRDVGSSSGGGSARQAGSRTSSHPHKGSPSPSSSPSAAGSVTPSSSPSASLSATPPSGGGGSIQGSSARDFVTSYYAALPGDTADAWASLSPQYQQRIGYDHYRGFWATIRSVSATDTRSAGPNAVDVSLTYTHDNGATESEVRRIYLQRSGDSYLISHDEIVG
jgi:serine/threonine protein kinase